MPGNPDDDKNIRQAYKEGKLTEEEIRNCAGHLVSMIRRLWATATEFGQNIPQSGACRLRE